MKPLDNLALIQIERRLEAPQEIFQGRKGATRVDSIYKARAQG